MVVISRYVYNIWYRPKTETEPRSRAMTRYCTSKQDISGFYTKMMSYIAFQCRWFNAFATRQHGAWIWIWIVHICSPYRTARMADFKRCASNSPFYLGMTYSCCCDSDNFITKKKTSRKIAICVFDDFHAAFDSVDHGYLLSSLREYNVPTKLVNIVSVIYQLAKACVRRQDNPEMYIPIHQRFLQGDCLSPICIYASLPYWIVFFEHYQHWTDSHMCVCWFPCMWGQRHHDRRYPLMTSDMQMTLVCWRTQSKSATAKLQSLNQQSMSTGMNIM